MDSYRVTSLLKRVTETKDIHLGKLIHAFLIKTAYQRRPARSLNTRKPKRSYIPRRAGRSCIRKRSARRYYTTGIGLKACSGVEAAEKGRRIRTHVVKVRLEGEVFMTHDEVDICVNCGNKKNARDLFDKMPGCAEVPWKTLGRRGSFVSGRETSRG